jgi:hypothetical protein
VKADFSIAKVGGTRWPAWPCIFSWQMRFMGWILQGVKKLTLGFSRIQSDKFPKRQKLPLVAASF